MHPDKSQNKKIILHMKTFFLLLAAAFLFLQTGKACTIIVAGKKATIDGFKFTHGCRCGLSYPGRGGPKIPQRKYGSRVLRHTAS